LLSSIWVNGQVGSISIEDSISGRPLPGCHLREAGTGRVWITNQEGQVPIPHGTNKWQVSHLGYKTKTVVPDFLISNTVLRLIPDEVQLEEVQLFSYDPPGIVRRLMEAEDARRLNRLYTYQESFKLQGRPKRFFQGQLVVRKRRPDFQPGRKWSSQLKAFKHQLDYLLLPDTSGVFDRGFIPNAEIVKLFFMNQVLDMLPRYKDSWMWRYEGVREGAGLVKFGLRRGWSGTEYADISGSIRLPLSGAGTYTIDIEISFKEDFKSGDQRNGMNYERKLIAQTYRMTVDYQEGKSQLRTVVFLEVGRVRHAGQIQAYELDLALLNHGPSRVQATNKHRLKPSTPWYTQFDESDRGDALWIPAQWSGN